MVKIHFTETHSLKTVKPAKTIFLNNTGRDVTLKFVTAPDLVLAAYTISTGISAAIDCIRLGVIDYYSCHSQNYAIAPESTVVLSLANNVLTMAVSP